ncbi:unnamed protein product, partial [marine sediment metagenome]
IQVAREERVPGRGMDCTLVNHPQTNVYPNSWIYLLLEMADYSLRNHKYALAL